MRRIMTTVTIDGKPTKYDIVSQFRFVGFIESLACRYEVLECPDAPEFAVVLREPYPSESARQPDLDKAEKVFENAAGHAAGFKPAFQWALNRVERDYADAYKAQRAAEQAEREKERAEAEKAKEAAQKAKGGKAATVKVQTAKVAANGDKRNGHTNGKGKRQVSQEAIRRKARG